MDKDTERYILNILRQGTVQWSGRSKCLKRYSKRVHDGEFFKNGKPKYKLHYQCASCKDWFKDPKFLEIDHIKEVGPLESWDKIKDFIERMYCPVENLQPLCSVCHQRKTSAFNASLRFKRKNQTGTP